MSTSFLINCLYCISFIAGSVNGANCKELAAQPDVDGFLVGGASLKVFVLKLDFFLPFNEIQKLIIRKKSTKILKEWITWSHWLYASAEAYSLNTGKKALNVHPFMNGKQPGQHNHNC